MTLRQKIQAAAEIMVFTVIRYNDNSDSTCGYLPVSKKAFTEEVKNGFLNGIDINADLDENNVLWVG